MPDGVFIVIQRTLLITNDFPPRLGGVQTFVYQLARRQPPDSLVVMAPDWPGAKALDADQPFPIIRGAGTRLSPTRAVVEQACAVVKDQRCHSVWFGAMFPLGLAAPRLREAGARRIIAQTHGSELLWSSLPGTRQLLQRIARTVDAVTVVSAYMRNRLAPALGGLTRIIDLPPGVDHQLFHPSLDDRVMRSGAMISSIARWFCVSRGWCHGKGRTCWSGFFRRSAGRCRRQRC
jgi:phosphatidylinositol alpha-1,6-mannosyltransferase